MRKAAAVAVYCLWTSLAVITVGMTDTLLCFSSTIIVKRGRKVK